MPAWNPQANDIFLDALEIAAPADRRAFIERACAGDTELQGQVVSLLEASQKAGSFLEIPPSAVAVQTDATIDQPITEKPGTVIGPYKLLQQIGEGGFGVVFMADQREPVKRRVALKIIKPGMDTRQVIARFEAERQALAMMDHPNIAKVLGAGTTESGRPYFVMELIKGIPITQYCDEKQLTPRQRLELFVPVCQALQHAHQKGIIHRDIKPSNVMVAKYDDRPVPKVIDFGVVKAIEQHLTEKTMFTQFGQIVGTVDYMSPEQADLNQLDIDTRSDIYSLGVLLYELLTGATPFDRRRLRAAAFDELLRIIREEEPPKPSLRLSSSASLPSIAANRQTEPRKLSTLVRGELDWIVMKALEKDRTRRYETANGLANDIRRYLHDEAVVACPPSAGYRFRKFARRNKVALATTSVVLAALMVGIVGTTWQAVRATREQRRAEVARREEAGQRAQAEQQRDRALKAEHRADEQATKAETAAENERQQRAEAVRQRDLTLQNLYVAHMQLAHQDWQDGLLPRMLQTIDAHLPQTGLPDQRGWEWYYLASLPYRHKDVFDSQLGPIEEVAWSPDGRLVAIGGNRGVKIYEPISQQVVQAWSDLAERPPLAWSPDGSQLAAASNKDGQAVIKIWNTQSWQVAHAPKRVVEPVKDIAWRPDGQALAWIGGEVLELWEQGKEEPETFHYEEPGNTQLHAMAWSPDGQRLVMANFRLNANPSRTGLVLWDDQQKAFHRGINDLHGYLVAQIAWSPAGQRLATASVKKVIKIWDVESWSEILRILGLKGQVAGVSWSPDGKRVVSGGEDTLVRIWDAETGKQLNLFPGHRYPIQAVDWSSSGEWIASGSVDGIVRFWRPSQDQSALVILGQNAVAWSPDGKQIAAQGKRAEVRTVRIFDSRTGQLVTELEETKSRSKIASLAWSPNGRFLAGAYRKGSTYLWDAESGRLVHHIPHAANSVAWSPDNRQFATGDKVGLKIWDASSGKLLQAPAGSAGGILSVSWSPDGRQFASADWYGSVKIWTTDHWQIKQGFQPTPKLSNVGLDIVHSLAWSPDSSHLAATGQSGRITVWNLQRETADQEFWSVDAHATRILSIHWSPDGTRLASGSTDNTTKIWEAATGRELLTLEGDSRSVEQVAWSPDGHRLASGSGNTVRIWDATEAYENPGANSPTKLRDRWYAAIQSGLHHRQRADQLQQAGRLADAETAYRDSLRLWDELVEAFDKPADDGKFRRHRGDTHLHLGKLYDAMQRPQDAEQAFRQAIGVFEQLTTDFPEEEEYRANLENTLRKLAGVLEAAQRIPEAEEAYRRAERLRRMALIERITKAPDRDFVSYRVRIGTPGEYRLYLRWDGHDRDSDSVFVYLVELADGPDGSVADIYEYTIHPDADFATLPGWQGLASFESDVAVAKGDPVVWTIDTPGDYTIRFVRREDGAALDALVLQLSSQPKPEGDGPAESATAGDKIYLESDGRVVVEAEHFANRRAVYTNWRVVPDEDPGDVVHLNYRGTGYLQALPDRTPENPGELVKNRGYSKAQMGRWDEALADFAEAEQLHPDDAMCLYFQAAASLALGDTEGFRQVCARMLERFGQTENPDTAHWVAWTCALAPEASSDLAAAVRLAEQAVTTTTAPSDRHRDTLGAILYRAGQFETAIEELDRVVAAWGPRNMPTLYSPAYTWFFLAMAHHRQGNAEQAREYLQQATKRAEQEIEDNAVWNRRLTLELLRREATALLSQEDLQPDKFEAEKSDSKSPAEKDETPDEKPVDTPDEKPDDTPDGTPDGKPDEKPDE